MIPSPSLVAGAGKPRRVNSLSATIPQAVKTGALTKARIACFFILNPLSTAFLLLKGFP